MLIRTIEDWEPGTVVLLKDGETIVARHPDGVGVLFGDERPLTLDFLKDFFPATLIHPRRFGDEDVEKVAVEMYDASGTWCSWANANMPIRHKFRHYARTALNALEGK